MAFTYADLELSLGLEVTVDAYLHRVVQFKNIREPETSAERFENLYWALANVFDDLEDEDISKLKRHELIKRLAWVTFN